MWRSTPSAHLITIPNLYVCTKSSPRRNFQMACISSHQQWVMILFFCIFQLAWMSFMTSSMKSGNDGIYTTSWHAPEFGCPLIYFERFLKSIYTGHNLAVPKFARCVELDQNMIAATAFSSLQLGSSVGALHWTLSCSSTRIKVSESYILEKSRSGSPVMGDSWNSLKGE